MIFQSFRLRSYPLNLTPLSPGPIETELRGASKLFVTQGGAWDHFFIIFQRFKNLSFSMFVEIRSSEVFWVCFGGRALEKMHPGNDPDKIWKLLVLTKDQKKCSKPSKTL